MRLLVNAIIPGDLLVLICLLYPIFHIFLSNQSGSSDLSALKNALCVVGISLKSSLLKTDPKNSLKAFAMVCNAQVPSLHLYY